MRCRVQKRKNIRYLDSQSTNSWTIKDENVEFEIYKSGDGSNLLGETFKLFKRATYATNKNFPDVAVTDVIESLFNVFGLKIVNNPSNNEISLVYLRDVLRDNEIIDYSMLVRHTMFHTIRLRSNSHYGGDDKDTAFNYDDWKNVETFTDYAGVMQKVNPYNKTCYIRRQETSIDSRIMRKRKRKETKLNCIQHCLKWLSIITLFLGEKTEDNTELSIKFHSVDRTSCIGDADEKLVDINPQRLAVFIPDVKMSKPQDKPGKRRTVFYYSGSIPIWDSGDHTQLDTLNIWESIQVSVKKTLNYDESEYKKPPLQEHDSGFTLGIMRGPGSEGSYEVYLEKLRR